METKTQASTAAAGAKIRLAVFDDYPGIAAVEMRNGLRPKKRREWEHLWTENPVCKRIDWPIGWVAENEQQEIVGYMGSIPFRCHFKGQDLVAATPHAMAMDPAHRGIAGFFLKRCSRLPADVFLVSTANEFSAKFNVAMRTARTPGNWDRSAFWITDYQGFLASACVKKGWPRLLSFPAASAFSIRDRLARTYSWTRQHDIEVGTCAHFDERFDLFWEELKRAYPERLLTARSSEDLQWHFKYGVAEKRVWITTIEEGSRLVAYAVFLRQDKPDIQLKRVRLIDFQVLNRNSQLLAPMLSWAVRRCQQEGIHMLEAFSMRADKQSVINGLAPRRRRLPAWLYFYRATSKALTAELQDPNAWDPCQYDGDGSL
ncbi:MAG: hypothetical protein ACRD3L_06520 [Terriglobales bacterium]